MHATTPFLLLLFFFFSPFFVSAQYPGNATELIRSYGYQAEEHWVQTLDGYLLLMNRIKTKGTPKAVVMFQHGLIDSSIGILLGTKTDGLIWPLVDMGYEVWLGNNRGNGVSMRHVKYTPNDNEFWDFTWEDMADYDFPAQINYVLSVSKFSKLTYIGHSEGTTQAFAGLILHPEVADKLSLYAALAPVAYVGNEGSLLLRFVADMDTDKVFQLLGIRDFYLPHFIEQFLPDLCQISPSACNFPLELLMGPTTHMNASRLPYILRYEPNRTSVKNMAHWAQAVRDHKFRRFDYGRAENLKRYGTATPPEFKLSKFPTHLNVALFAGAHDYLGDPADVKRLVSELPISPLLYQSDYGHIDFLWGLDARQKVFSIVYDLIQKFQSK